PSTTVTYTLSLYDALPISEYLALLLFSILGTMLVGAAGDLLMIFLGIEMGSLAVYALTGFARRRTTSLEGALKYFLLGAFATARSEEHTSELQSRENLVCR